MNSYIEKEELQVDKYIGIPYKLNGRSLEEIDCWGLVRLVCKDEMGIDLPSFVGEGDDSTHTQELVSQYNEGWELVNEAKAGDIVVFRIMGVETHVGIAINSTHFLHARNGHSSAIESLSSPKWKTRLTGTYRYSPKNSVILNGIPHPLKTQFITTAVPAGTRIADLEKWIIKEYNIQPELKTYIRVMVNGKVIDDALKQDTILLADDSVEYRVVAQGDSVNSLLAIAVIIIAPQLVPLIGTIGGVALTTAAGGLTLAGSAVAMGLTAIGMALVNAIAPVRMPQANFGDPTSPESPERQMMITGGANQATQYAPIPVVLGKVRMTPPLGANSYYLFSGDGRESYLRMLLVWGYGPLYIDESTLKIGELPIENYEKTYQETINYISTPGSEELASFNGLYGTDITQVGSNVELSCDGTAGAIGTTVVGVSVNLAEGVSTYTLPGNYISGTVALTRIVFASTIAMPFSLSGLVVNIDPVYELTPRKLTYSVDTGVLAPPYPGPWLDSVSNDGSVSTISVAVHFPQGIRKIKSKGDGAGSSSAAPVTFNIEWKPVSSGNWINSGARYTIGGSPIKDAFTWVESFNVYSGENVQVRIRRITGTGNTAPVDEEYQWLFQSTLLNVTYARNTKPAVNPVNANIAKTAIQIKASGQLNGQIEGINAIVQTWGWSWNGSAWVGGVINNPAALFRHVLEHPANPRRVTDAASKINLAQIQYWHEYCTAKGFTFNAVVASTRSVLDILRDICAAGRASPAMIDGKWTVVIDEPKSNVVQHFSPHNSWGFEGAKALPRIPDGLRVTFVNEDKNYQQDETIVYATANSQSNAALLENISVPGVTKLAKAQDHARWHMAQAKLRPEIYTLSTDIEYIVCNRGDRVKVMHDVPMWGLGSGRIKNRILSNIYELTEEVPVDDAASYSFRIRSKTGGSTEAALVKTFTCTQAVKTNNIVTITLDNTGNPLSVDDSVVVATSNSVFNTLLAKVSDVTANTFSYTLAGVDIVSTAVTGSVSLKDGYYSKVKIGSSLAASAADNDDLFLYGTTNQESQDCIVLSIEPTSNKSARLTLVDYGVTSTANIFTDYLNYTNTLTFESQISLPPTLLIQSFGTKVPTITGIVSNETVMERVAPGVFAYKMRISYSNASSLPSTTTSVEFQWDFAAAVDSYGIRNKLIEYNKGSITIAEVEEGEILKVRCRYVGSDGRTGLWTAWQNHTIIGKTTPPSTVTNFTASADNLTGKLNLSWSANTELDIKGYEVRTDTVWGSTTNLVFSGNATSCTAAVGLLNVGKVYYIKALDYANLYSTTAATFTYTLARPANYTGTVTFSYADTSTTDSTVTFNWTAAPLGVFAINTYELTLTRPGGIVTVQEITGLTWTTRANWVDTATLSIKSKDIQGNTSLTGYSSNILKNRPAAPAAITQANFKVVDSQVYLNWPDVSRVSNGLPVGGYEVRKDNANWGVVNANFVSKVSLSEAIIKDVVSGSNTWYVNTFDTDNIYATSGTIATFIATPPNVATNINKAFSTTSTAGTVTITWEPPTVTTFGIDKYKVKLTRPDLTFVSNTVDAFSWTIAADWAGSATFTIVTVDVLGSESSVASLSIVKELPSSVGIPNKIIKDRSIYVDWPNNINTSLYVVGYEIRTTDSGWGNSSYVFKGAVSAAELVNIVEGLNTWYIKAYDTSGFYSANATTITQTITKPLATTINTPVFANSSATGTTITFSWVGNKSTFNINRYSVTLTRGAVVSNAVVTGDNWTVPVDWAGTATFQISAIDTFDLIGTSASTTVIKVVPTAPVSYTVVTNTASITIKWPAAVQGSLPIAGYELRPVGTTPGGADFTWKGSANSVDISTLVLGTNTWDLWTYDTDNKYSTTPRLVSYTVARPSDPTSLQGVFDSTNTSNTAKFAWVKPSSSTFGIAKYEVSLTTTNPVRTITNTRNTNDWVVTADWLDTATLSVTAVDSLGISSNTVSTTLVKSLPSQPAVFFPATPTGTALELDWPDAVKTSLPIAGYELRTTDSGWAGGGYVWKGNVSTATIDIKGTSVGTTLTWYLKTYDTDNRYSISSRAYSYQVLAPVNTSSLTYKFEDTNLTSATIILAWTDTAPIFGLKHYEVSGTISLLASSTAGSNIITVTGTKGLKVGDKVTVGTTVPVGRTITSIINTTQLTLDSSTGITTGTSISTSFTNYRYSNATTITLPADWLGDKSFTVKTVDNLNNQSTGTTINTTKALPGIPTGLRAQVIDNNVLLYWNLPAITTLPISHTRIKKGSTWNTAELIGDKSGTFTNITELIGSTYTYWIAVVDTDNNESLPVSLGATVSSPPDYIFNAEWTSTFTSVTSVLSNALLEPNTGYLVLPVDTTETFGGHFTSRGWVGPEDPVGTAGQIDQGYPVYIQPGLTSGYYEEVFDYGTTLGSSQVSVALAGINVSGLPTVTVTISTSLDNILYDKVYANTTTAFASSFRYIKIRVAVTQVTSGNVYSVQSLVIRLDAKQKTDSGTVVMQIGGAQPQGNISHDYIDLWVPGSLPTTQYTLVGTASENSITNQAGPGGFVQPIWNCIDSDIEVTNDGGWVTTGTTVDNTKGHLIAVFVKRSTTDGITYFGTNTNSTISTLAGAVNANPYFISGVDLPALNTWYLLVGYVHEIGYGTTDTNISGIYNLSGTRLVAGTEYKFNTTTTLSHRVFHYANPTNSGAIVQQMARPVVLECTTANAPNMITYILQCANSYGMSVTPSQSFIDVTSIMATSQGSIPSTALVDFNDIPSPKRFNIFNYNFSGTIVSGTVSWTTRGY